MTRRVKIKSGLEVRLKGDSRNKRWITSIIKDGYIPQETEKQFLEVKRRAEALMRKKYKNKFKFYYGSTKLPGKWGPTFIIWPTSPMSRKYPRILDQALMSSDFKVKSKTFSPTGKNKSNLIFTDD